MCAKITIMEMLIVLATTEMEIMAHIDSPEQCTG